MNDKPVLVIGAGLAGTEAAWQIAQRNIPVKLYEMRPNKKSPAHRTGLFAELVCSNSLRAAAIENAVGLLKEEMRKLDSLIINSAYHNQVPAGGALAVDREGFSQYITSRLEEHPLVEIIRQEVINIPKDDITVIATGPLTSEGLTRAISDMIGSEYLYFYDAAAPIVTKESLNMDIIFLSSRYGKGEAAYLNCPMSKEEYTIFHGELVNAERAEVKEFEKQVHFEGCMPVEVLASRGRETLTYGPLKPVGLTDPRTGKRPFAVVQLRQDNLEGTLYNMVGFQTNLKWGEQKRVFRLIPGMEQAEFVRYGVMHRNTYINSPSLLKPTLQFDNSPNLFFAGQITGVEGYVESAASGLLAGINAARVLKKIEPIVFPRETAIGSLIHYINNADSKNFQPMNVTFGLFSPLENRIRDKKARYQALAKRALDTLDEYIKDAKV